MTQAYTGKTFDVSSDPFRENEIKTNRIVSQTMDFVEYTRTDGGNAIRLLKIWRHRIINS